MWLIVLLPLVVFVLGYANPEQDVENRQSYIRSLAADGTITNSQSAAFGSLTKEQKNEVLMELNPLVGLLWNIPLSVITLGNILLLITSETDFSLASSSSVLLYPNSFKATMVDVTLAMQDALQLAHGNMDIIKENVEVFPKTLNLLKSIVENGTTEDIINSLPKAVSLLEGIGNKCNELATAVGEKFDRIIRNLAKISKAVIHKKLHESEKESEESISLISQSFLGITRLQASWADAKLVFGESSDKVTHWQGEAWRLLTQCQNLVKKAESSKGDKSRMAKYKQNLKNKLNKDSVHLIKTSYYIFLFSRSYLNVSEKFMMERIISLHELAMVKDTTSRHEEFRKLLNGLNAIWAANNATTLAHENKYKEHMKAFQQRIKEEIESMAKKI